MASNPKKNVAGPRRRATQARATTTVAAIVEAAAHILETRGLEGYTTNAVAERAGASIGSLYQYFSNKDAITLALVQRESLVLVTEVQRAAQTADWRQALEDMVDAAVRHQLRRPVLARLLDFEEARLAANDVAAPGAGEIYQAIRGVLARANFVKLETLDTLTVDLIGITRGMSDAAGRARELDANDLQRRIGRAVFSYLEAGRHPKHS